MKIALDGMGGDKAPGVTVEGAVNAASKFGYQIILVGKKGNVVPNRPTGNINITKFPRHDW